MNRHDKYVMLELGQTRAEQYRTQGMTYPVRCNCGQIYDIGRVEVYARYADCSCWMTPCCNRHEDDRIGIRKYTELRP